MSEVLEEAPRVFISYRWSSPEHEDWVLLLASQLRGDGVDVILDKWHLSEGQDTLAFMEGAVTDTKTKKIILVCDEGYVSRANSREGGVGTEAQIISPHVYAKVDQNKVAAIVLSLDSDGRPVLPLYMATRLYFDMSNAGSEAANYEKVVRWIFNKPFYSPPAIGKPPAYLTENFQPRSSGGLGRQRISHARRTSLQQAQSAAISVLEEVVSESRGLYRALASQPDQDEIIYLAIKSSFPILENAFSAFTELLRSDEAEKSTDAFHDFFEHLLENMNQDPENVAFTRWDHDAIKFFNHDCLVSFVAIALKERKFQVAADALSMPLYKQTRHDHTGKAASYTEFRHYIESLDSRNRRLNMRRISLHADIIAEHHEHSLVPFRDFIEADVTLHLRGMLAPKLKWYPWSSIFLERSYGALPTYTRARSSRFYDRFKPLILNTTAEALRTYFASLSPKDRSIRFDYHEIELEPLINLQELGTEA